MFYRYGFNGKEKDGSLAANTEYDFGERIYNPTIGKWLTLDPMADKREWLSPYNFVQNDPIHRLDPNGALDWVKDGEGNIKWDKDANSQSTTKKGETPPLLVFFTNKRN